MNKSDKDKLCVLPVDAESKAFVLDGWLKSYRKSPWAGVVPNNLYWPTYSACLQQLIARGMQIMVLQAAKHLNLDSLLGFVAFELPENEGKPVIHYIYTKDGFRKQGLASFLLSEVGIDPKKPFLYTFRTKAARYAPRGLYEPGIGRRQSLEPSKGPRSNEKAAKGESPAQGRRSRP